MVSILSNITEAVDLAGGDMARKPIEYPAGPRKIAPMPPGAVLAGILDDVRMSARAAATRIGVSHNALAKVLSGKSVMTAEMALRVGKLCGNGPELWLNLQRDHDLWRARQAIGKAVERIAPIQRGE